MAELWKGAPVAAAINERVKTQAEALQMAGITPTLAVVRVGQRDSDLSYERGILKRFEQVGIAVKQVVFPEDVCEAEFFDALECLNGDDSVHGILLFRPLPHQIDGERARSAIHPAKDVDGCTDGSLAGVFTNSPVGFAPCTAQAALEILKFYGADLTGKRVAVIGRSLVIGRPVAMLLMHQNATVTLCHTKTADVPAVTREADIVVAASGQMESVTREYLRPGQQIIDVGISWNEARQKLCGDVLFEEAEPLAAAITPVPGGVGAVTTSVLALHVVEAALRAQNR